MRIKKLELIGFKSFKDRTVIHYDKGITGVVGPNGCGKSNIVDALVWVMGEMSAKHLRGSSMEDVIFAGAEGYAPMGMAEVSLTLENDGGPFPAKFAKHSEIMITRRLHRSGESEYLINKEPARLRDIQEVFMDTGAGSKGFSIIEQGAIGKIITSKPIERRTLIEEAAGITKFKVRKRESQRKLSSTDQNLLRLQDILAEQKRQLNSLERQAQRAERYRKIKSELQEKDVWLSSKQYLEIHDETHRAQNLFEESRDKEASVDSDQKRLELEVQTMKLGMTEQEAAVNQKQESHQKLTTDVTNAEFRIRELNMAIEQGQKTEERTGSLVSQYELRKSNLTEEKSKVDEQLEENRQALQQIESEYLGKNETYMKIQERINELDTDLTDKRREMLSLSTGLSHMEAREQSMVTKVEERKETVESRKKALEVVKNNRQEFEQIRNKVYQDVEAERQMHLTIEKDAEALQSQLNELKAKRELNSTELESLKDELNKVASRLYGLENLQNNFEGFEAGVKSVMMWQKEREQESFQPLAEVVEIPAEYELAMEASLGNRLQTLLSSSKETTLSAVDYLKAGKSGRSSFASGDMQMVESTPSISTQIVQEEGVRAQLQDIVRVPEQHQGQVAHFLKDIVIVDSIRTALALRAKYPGRSFVTMDGDLLSADGILTGGATDQAESGVLRRRREIKELSQKREEFAGKVQLAQLAMQKLDEEFRRQESELEAVKANAVEKEILIAQIKKDLERAEQEFQNALSAYQRESEDLQREESLFMEAENALEQLRGELLDIRTRKEALELEVTAKDLELETCRGGIGAQGQEVSDLRVKLASRQQETEGLERQSLYLGDSLRDLEAQLNDMSEESKKTQTELTEHQVTIETLQNDLTRMIHQVSESEKDLAETRNAFEVEMKDVRAKENRLSELRGELNNLRGQHSEAVIKLEQLKMKEESLVVQMKERYDQDLRELAHTQRDVPGNMEEIGKEVVELRDKVKRIGEVNLAAIQEYDELIERYEFLKQQHNDLLEAKEHLRKVIDRINRICSRRFKETFEQVNGRFKQVFPVLFGGGEARLILLEDPEADEPGIDIVAKPPGKKLQSVSLLSGGEKALTAVSLIFSIFLVKPSPFCLLDEVDAPLDDANVMRFNELVKEMAKRSQIIVVTHNKHTMKVNNKLYGVTMQEKGVSKMVSVSLEDAAKLAEA